MSNVREWSPAVGLVVCSWLLSVAAGLWFAALVGSGSDPAGTLLAGVATVGSAGAAAFGSRARPRLRADADGLTVGGFLRARHHPWPLIQSVRVLTVRRWGRDSSLLEIDTVRPDGAEQLLLFGRLDLADDPHDVAAELLTLRPHRSP